MKYIVIYILTVITSLAFAIDDKDYNGKYDPARDSFADFEAAKKDAQASGKLILVEFGGEWCVWCHRIEKFILANPEINSGIDDVFIFLKVNVSDDNKNDKFISQFPEIKGYPFFAITDSSGVVIGSQNTGLLEKGKGYSAERFKEFIAKWKAVQAKQK
ncbi:thioredoxin family protein [Cellvibrio mixtus]|uniref:thioredoxin family protein n=1 Tax=Cellvibrio mixtus TaxID=39650 RepID=UPI000587A313|nr:thioredoxin family protein [Cellvibrio mixtus]